MSFIQFCCDGVIQDFWAESCDNPTVDQNGRDTANTYLSPIPEVLREEVIDGCGIRVSRELFHVEVKLFCDFPNLVVVNGSIVLHELFMELPELALLIGRESSG